MHLSDLPPVVRCPMCGAAMAAGATQCAECGELRPGQTADGEKIPRPASTGDIAIAVIVAVLALVLTLPGNIGVSYAGMQGNFDAMGFLLISLWNALVWGLPIVELGYWWRRGVVRGYPERTYLWRVYSKSQSAALGIIIGLFLLLLTICAAAM